MRQAPSVGVRVVIAMLRAYKLVLSPFFAGSCRFLPSCSDYAREAVETHGVRRGGCLAAGRLLRCHPLAAAGFDPVPPRRAPAPPATTDLLGSSHPRP